MSQLKKPENPRSNLSPIVGNFQLLSGKIWLFPEKTQLYPKIWSFIRQNFWWPFLVMNSKFRIFPYFRQQHDTFPYFSAESTRKNIISRTMGKNQKNPRTFEKHVYSCSNPVEGKEKDEDIIHSFIANIYIAPLYVGYSEALPTPGRPNNVVLSCWRNIWENTLGSDRRASGRPFYTKGPTTEKARLCIVEVRANYGTWRRPGSAERGWRVLRTLREGRQRSVR